jgi:hypothetical protein
VGGRPASPQPASRGGGRARQSREQRAESREQRAESREQRLQTYSSRKLGPVLVLQPPLHPRLHHHFSSLTLTLPLSSTSTSCTIIRLDPLLSSQRRHLPSASPWRRILLFVLPASSSCTTHPRRRPILERRIVQPPLQLIIITASGQSPCQVLPQRVQKHAFDPDFGPRELDLPGLVHGTIFVFTAALLPTIETAPHTISATRRL